MALRAPAAFDPEPMIEGLRYAGYQPERLTPARQKVLEMAADGLSWTKSGLAHASGVSTSVIDGLVNLVGTSAKQAGGFVYNRIDQGVVDTVVKGSGLAAEGSGSVLRKTQNGKVQWYAAYLFLGATILAAIFVVVAS